MPSELRRDPVTDRWVIISADRRKRPNDFRIEHATVPGREPCPFCPGHESMTPPEIVSYRQDGSAPDTPGWDLRIVPNKYPALLREGGLDRAGDGVFERMPGIGAHEVIIETPDHNRRLALMPEPEIARVLWAWRERILDLSRDAWLKYILVFKNHGAAAGATLEHPHSQLIALPIVPGFAREEIDSAKRHFGITQRCVFCDITRQDVADGRRVILENADVVALAPYASRFPFETWILPKRHGARFEDALRHEYEALAGVLKPLLQRMDRALEEPAFNLIVHTSPNGEDTSDVYHWHMEILPKLTQVAGFEWGTGFSINPTPPEEAAGVLRSVRL